MPQKRDTPPRSAYVNAHAFLLHLRQYEYILTRQQLKTLRGQALAGDVDGAMKGLGKILLAKRNGE